MQKILFTSLLCMGLCTIFILLGLFGIYLGAGVLSIDLTPVEQSATVPPASISSTVSSSSEGWGETAFLFVFFILIAGLVFFFCIAFLLSKRLTARLVRPIEAMAGHLDDIEPAIPFEELRPFALRIKEQQHKRDQTEKMRQEFTANVSHELKTPLTSISGYAEMLENGMVREEDIAEFAGKIHNEAGRLISLIGDIIQLAELDEPHPKQEFKPVNLTEIAYRTADLLSLQAERAGVSLSVRGEKCLVLGSQKMLDELVYNLCDNAIRYNRNPGSVIISVQNKQDCVLLSVSDTGIGISKEHQSRIFERFYRVDKSRSKETGGTGLGLAIVKHIALQHHAKITVTSEENRGTLIQVSFTPCAMEDGIPKRTEPLA